MLRSHVDAVESRRSHVMERYAHLVKPVINKSNERNKKQNQMNLSY